MVTFGCRTWGKMAEHSVAETFLTTSFSESRLINQIDLTSDFTRYIKKVHSKSPLTLTSAC